MAQRQFRRMDPPSFTGQEEDDMVADSWLTQVESIFERIDMVEDDLRLATAPYYLRGEAAEWWKSR